MGFLAYDLGASNGRAILGQLSNGRLSIKEIRRFPNSPVRTATHLHWNTFHLLNEIQQSLVDCKNETGSLPESIGVNTWGVDFGLVDADGDLVSQPIHYRDESRDSVLEEIDERVTQEQLFYWSGYNMICSVESLYYMFNKKPHIVKAANSILFTPDLLSFFLCGNRYAERSICSTSKVLNNEKGVWSLEALASLGIDPGYFHEVIEPGTKVGNVLPSILDTLGLEGDVSVIAVAGHDTASAAAAVPAREDDFAYISCGTWSIVGASAPKVILTKEVFENKGSYDCSVNGGADMRINISGLWILQEIKRCLAQKGEDYSYPELTRLVADAEPFTAVIDPDDELFFHPGNMDGKVRQFCRDTDQQIPDTVGGLCRVVLESLALKYRDTINRIEKMLAKKLPVVYMVGGGIQNGQLCQYTASACQRPVMAGPVEATVFGNLLMQAKAMDSIKNMDEGRELLYASCEIQRYEPQYPGLWEKQYDLAKSLFK